MGRSRAVPQPADEDPTQSRSKRKRTASNVENLESATTGQGTNEGKKALYHCNYCNKDISGKIRIKCVLCPDFDLCLECFSVGAEVTPHKSNHPYRVMHKELSFSNLWHRTYFRVWHMFRVAVDLEIFDNSHSVELRSCRSSQRLRHGGVF